jgi:Family of unknown function (DUF5990)
VSVHVRIVGTDLPGIRCGGSPDHPTPYEPIHVAVQRGQEPVQRVRADAEVAVFDFDVDVRNGRFAGPFVHGRDGQRFVYVMWGEVIAGDFRMFRRAKLHLDGLDAAALDGATIEATVTLTDAKGHPTCASVRTPDIAWKVAGRSVP